jgi:hypothetical protein
MDAGTALFALSNSKKVVLLTVVGSTALLNAAVTGIVELTPLAPFGGVTDKTTGGCDELEVANDQAVLEASAVPDVSFTRGSVAPPRTSAV